MLSQTDLKEWALNLWKIWANLNLYSTEVMNIQPYQLQKL